jgi:hypothetical protein
VTEKRCEDASHSQSTSCEGSESYPVSRKLLERARVLASPLNLAFGVMILSLLSSGQWGDKDDFVLIRVDGIDNVLCGLEGDFISAERPPNSIQREFS